MVRILSMIRKEFIQVLRDRRMLALLLIIPIVQLIIFGYAINLDIKNIRLGLLDNDRSYYSRDLLKDFQNPKHTWVHTVHAPLFPIPLLKAACLPTKRNNSALDTRIYILPDGLNKESRRNGDSAQN